MKKFYLVLMIIFIGVCCTSVFAKENKAVWTVEIIGAKDLMNADIPFNGLSDPYAEVSVNSTKLVNYTGMTPVIENSLNPQWNYKIKLEYAPDEKIINISVGVWDKDKHGKWFLGCAELLRPYPGRIYTLNMHPRVFLNSLAPNDNFYLPGSIKISVTRKSPLVDVPDLIRKSNIETRDILNSAGFKPELGYKLVRNPAKEGKVVSQSPKAGEKISHGSIVRYYLGKQPRFPVPDVIGKNIHLARYYLHAFRHVTIEYKAPRMDTPRDQWMKIGEQEPRAGSGNYPPDQNIHLIINRPPADFKIVMPDLTANNAANAIRSLREAKAPGVKILKQRSADESKNDMVLDQNPVAGTKIPWQQNSPVSITIGWFANGRSLYSAKPVEFNKPFKVIFDKKDMAEFLYFKIEKTGYLVLESKTCPDNIVPRSIYYQYENGWHERTERRQYLPSGFRVTPGEWIVRIEPEMSGSVNPDPAAFEFSFINEFDKAEPNDNFDQAVGINPNAQLELGFIGAGDEDYYSFVVEKSGYLEVLSEKMIIDGVDNSKERGLILTYSIYNDKKESIANYNLGTAVFLSPGKYYFKVGSSEGLWNRVHYKISFIFHNAQDVGEPDNNSKDGAYSVDVGTTIPVAYSMNDDDFYLIKSNTPGYAILSHDIKIPFDINFERYDKNGKSTDHSGYLPAAVRIDKERLVSLHAVSEGSGYLIDPPAHLTIGFVSADEDKFEPNDIPQKAVHIELNKTYHALLLPEFDEDNYKFSVKQPGKISIDFRQPQGKEIVAKGRLLTSDGKTIIADNLYLPCDVNIKNPGNYIIEFGQEPGTQKMCLKQYALTIKENLAVQSRYGNAQDSACIEKAREAFKYLNNLKFDIANKLYAEALQCLPKNKVIWNDYGVSFFRMGKKNKAEKAFKKAVSLENKYALPYRNLAVLAWQNNNLPLGKQMAEKAAELDPSDKNLQYAAHSNVLLSQIEQGENKTKSLETAAFYYKKIKNLSKKSKFNLDLIHKMIGKKEKK